MRVGRPSGVGVEMGDTKHTPGPWAVDGPPWNQIVSSSAENRVCFLAHSNGLDDERDIATGHLIASAPDLLIALKTIALHAPSLDVAGIRELCDAAIARAEGRSE